MFSRHLMLRSVAFTALVLSTTTAHATSTPSSADASRIGKNFVLDAPAAAKQSPVSVKGVVSAIAPSGAESVKLTLQSITLEGATVYSPEEIQSVYADKVGQKISLADVYDIAAALTTKYRNDGYILTQVVVPPQTISGGNIKLRAVEGVINQINIDGAGAQGSDAVIIRKYVDALKSKGALRNADLEQTLLLINDLPGVTARSVLSPSSATGASDLTIMVERDRVDGTVQVDNFGSRYLGMWEIIGAMNLNSIFGMNERIATQLAYAPSNQGVEPELLYGQITGEIPFGPYGTSLEANIGKSYTNPGAGLEPFDVLGKSYVTGLKLNQPIIRTRDLNISSSLGLDRRSTDTKSNVDTFRNDDITSLRLSGHADFVDTVFQAAYTSANIELSRGLTILGASKKSDADLTRPAGDPQYTKITADVTRLERLSNQFSLQMAANSQLANGAMLSAEEFGVGGANAIGRGYDPSELAGDDGVSASLELQWNSPYSSRWMDGYTVYGFYDIGKVWNDDAITTNLKEQSLASTGVGFRATINQSTRAGFMVAVPLTRDVAAEGDNDPRVYVNFTHNF